MLNPQASPPPPCVSMQQNVFKNIFRQLLFGYYNKTILLGTNVSYLNGVIVLIDLLTLKDFKFFGFFFFRNT